MRTSFGRRVLTVILGLQVVSIGAILGWYFYFVGQDMRVLARHAAELTVTDVIGSTELYFQPAKTTVEQLVALSQGGVLSAEDGAALEQYMLERLQAVENLDGLYLAWPDGAFFYVNHDDSRAAGGFRTKRIAIGEDGRSVTVSWRSAEGAEVASEDDPEDSFDPRTRPWYLAAEEAGALVWTEPYVFFTARAPGITVAKPLYDAEGKLLAVAGVDIGMARISAKLGQLSFSHGGSALIVDDAGRVLAHPNEVVISAGDGDALTFREVETLQGVGGALAETIRTKQVEVRGSPLPLLWQQDWNDRSYQVAIAALDAIGWPWSVVAVVGENRPVEALRGKVVVLGLVVATIALLSLVLGLLVARSLDGPLAQLQTNAKLARNGNLELMNPLESGDAALKDADLALHEMAGRLRGAQPPDS